MDMQDRELLEMAAKAAIYVIRWYEDTISYGPIYGIEVEPGNPCGFEPWNPLADDVDALRLANSLHLCVCHTLGGIVGAPGTVMVGLNMWENNAPLAVERYSGSGDAGEAVRRAIVRAAAEIGRATT